MDDSEIPRQPGVVAAILLETEALGFTMASEPRVGALLQVLAASKPGGRFLELGTGTGHGTAWLLAGMDAASTLDTVDTDPHAVAVARRHLGSDGRVNFHLMDGAEFLRRPSQPFDLIFADAWPGKFTRLDDALSLLRQGGVYVADDLLPQSTWPEDHEPKVQALLANIERRDTFVSVRLAWASGIAIVVRQAS